ncbi:hypothetical protein GWI33_020351 [Rhynchophorus ferrugineus]|uniref:Uncharacterized protein n=1 Tax=Rhynchophorus ferrugineus TaxID=354439 RepID=A0A834M0K4_RHYFE|nr:hypothetical protein GWI33_020351 [Rhynchophorus ferrugineus]
MTSSASHSVTERFPCLCHYRRSRECATLRVTRENTRAGSRRRRSFDPGASRRTIDGESPRVTGSREIPACETNLVKFPPRGTTGVHHAHASWLVLFNF